MADISIAEVRSKYPQYGDMTDEALAKALHDKYYSDIPYKDFASKIGLPSSESTVGGVVAEGAKGLVRGAGSTARMIPEGALKAVLGPIAPLVMAQLDKLSAPAAAVVQPSPQGTAEQMASTGGEIAGASIAGGGANGVRSALINVVAPAVGGAVGEQVAGTPGRVIGSIAPAVAQIAIPAAAATVRGIVRGADTTQATQRLNTLDQVGVRPTLEDVAPNRAFLEKTMSKAPGAQQIQNKAVEGQAEDLKAAVQKLIPEAEASPTTAGQAIKEGLSEWKDSFMATWRKLDAKTSELLGNPPVNASSTRDTLEKLSAKIDDPELNALFQNPKIAAIKEALDKKGGIVDINTLIQLRREIGEQAASAFSQLKSDMSGGELKALYGALSTDIKRAAETTGNPAVLNAIERQNAYYKAGSDRISAYYGRLVKQADPDKVFAMLDSQSKAGSVGVQNVMKALPQDARDEVISAVLQRMGKAKSSAQNATGEIFSPETLLTNWNKYTPEAKRALFGGSSNPELMSGLNKLADAASIIRESGKVLGNPSGTGAVLTNYGTLGALIFKPIETMSIIGSSTAGVYLMTNPKFLRWAVQATQVNGNDLGRQITNLAVIANSSRDQKFKDAVSDYADALEASNKGVSGVNGTVVKNPSTAIMNSAMQAPRG